MFLHDQVLRSFNTRVAVLSLSDETSRGMYACIPPSLNQDYNAAVGWSDSWCWPLTPAVWRPVLTQGVRVLSAPVGGGGGGCLGKHIQTVLEYREESGDMFGTMWYPYIPKCEWDAPPKGSDWGTGARHQECDQHTQTHTDTVGENSYLYSWLDYYWNINDKT